MHVHLDTTRIGLPFRPHTGASGVWGMMMNDRRNWREAEVPITERVAYTLERFKAVLETHEIHSDQADVQIMVFH